MTWSSVKLCAMYAKKSWEVGARNVEPCRVTVRFTSRWNDRFGHFVLDLYSPLGGRKEFVMKRFQKMIAFLLTVVLLLGCLPANVLAVISDAVLESVAPDASASLTETTPPIDESAETVSASQECIDEEIVGEVVELTGLREENVKHFRLANGTYQAVVYEQPVHRKDDAGLWQDIDNRLTVQKEAVSHAM